jgi:hypothetical protein
MGKDREGAFHPEKGKPSDEGTKKGNDAHSATIDEQIRIEEEYEISEDGQVEAAGVHIRHTNRNEDKSRERTKPDARRGSITRQQELSNHEQPRRDNHVRKSDDVQEHFFVLILSKKNAKFFRGDVSGLHHVDISELPNGINDVVHLEEKDDQNLYRTGSSGGGMGSNYHGMGGGTPDEKENISMYLKEVDRTLWQSGLNKEKALLVVGGVEYICVMFKDITQYKHCTGKCLTGSFENVDPREIYKKAKAIVSPAAVTSE